MAGSSSIVISCADRSEEQPATQRMAKEIYEKIIPFRRFTIKSLGPLWKSSVTLVQILMTISRANKAPPKRQGFLHADTK